MRAFPATLVGLLALTAFSAQAGPPSPARSGDILVTAQPGEKRSPWKRAESDHVIVTSDGSEGELKRVSRNLELLYRVMSKIYRRDGGPDDTVKLQVTLFGSPAVLRAIGGRSATQETYLPAFNDPTYYDPRANGEVLAIVRSDLAVKMNTMRAYQKDCEEVLAAGGNDCSQNSLPYHDPAITTWEQLLYARFAQHFLLTYQPAPYPRWYLDGIAAIFGNIVIGRDYSVDYGRPPSQYRQTFRSYGDLDLADVLTGRYLDLPPDKRDWSPAHAWLLTHYFLFAIANSERSRQFQHYMAEIQQGVPMADAAKVFGDMKLLQRQLRWRVESDIIYAHAKPPPTPIEEPLITNLSPASAALIEARLELGTPIDALPGTTGATSDTQAEWLTRARDAARTSDDRETLLFAAEAECHSHHPDACRTDAERVLAATPDDAEALAWKGEALTDLALTGPAAARADTLAAARQTIARAVQIGGDAPLPLIAWFRSYTAAGEPVPELAMRGMAEVVHRIPAAPGPRLDLAQELVRQGKPDLARRLLNPVLYGPYDTPEKAAANRLFVSEGGAPHAG